MIQLPSMYSFLTVLERYDNQSAEDALIKALNKILTPDINNMNDNAKENIESGINASTNIFYNYISNDKGKLFWQAYINFADQRLTAWHSFKINALETAYKTDPGANNLIEMRKQIIINLRQGLNDNQFLVPDAHFIQSLARVNHSFSFGQAMKEFKEENPNIPQDHPNIKHCAICADSFKYLV